MIDKKRPNETEPTVTRKDGDIVYAHESYAAVSVTRVTGGKVNLFGSEIRDHLSRISFRITPAERINRSGRDWFFPHRRVLIEFEMTQAQFAEMVTSIGQGGGVPCTLRYVNGVDVPRPAAVPTPDAVVTQRFRERVGEVVQRSKELGVRLRAFADSTRLTRPQRDALLTLFGELTDFVSQEAPYLHSVFNEVVAAQRTSALREVEALLTHAAVQLGLTQLADRATKLLGAEEDDES